MTVSKDNLEVLVKLDGAVQLEADVLSVQQYVGGRSSDTVVFENRPYQKGPGDVLQFQQLRNAFPDLLCEVLCDFPEGMKRIFWGRTTAGSYMLSDAGETIRYTARCEPYMLGIPLEGKRVATRPPDVSSFNLPSKFVVPHHVADVVFNPVVDGKAIPNCTTIGGEFGFVEPDSVWPTTLEDIRAARDELIKRNPTGWQSDRDGSLRYWTLAGIVEYLARTLGTSNLTQPTRDDLQPMLGTDARLVRDLRLTVGKTLFELLDEVLTPYGFTWMRKYDTPSKPALSFQRLGNPLESLTLNLQLPGESVDFEHTDVQSINCDFDASDNAANLVTVIGDYEYREGTFELVPAWESLYDDITGVLGFEEYLEGSASWKTTPGVRRAWRDWVLNEAGDYTGICPTITRAYNFGDFFDFFAPAPRRRKFLETLTRLPSGGPVGDCDGIIVEWSRDGGTNWHSVRDEDNGVEHGSSFMRLQNECGVRFTSPTHFPSEMYDVVQSDGWDQLKVRVTATVRSDHRMTDYASVTDSSLLATPKIVVIDMKDKYRYRKVHQREDKWKSQAIVMPEARLGEVDDWVSLQALSDNVAASSNHASLNGRIERFGVYHAEKDLGRTVSAISGRSIDFTLNHERAVVYLPTVRAIETDFQRQRTVYYLDTPKARR